MSYIHKYYITPFIKAAKDWKTYVYTLAIETVFLGIIGILFYIYLQVLDFTVNPLADNNLTDKLILLAEVNTYNKELEVFIFSLLSGFLVLMLISFVLYVISRGFIWSYLLKTKRTWKQYFFVDGLLWIIAIILLVLLVIFVKPIAYPYYVLFTIIPLLFFSFLCHLQYNKKTSKKIIRSAFSSRMITILPHILIGTFIALIAREFFLLLSIMILNFIRMYIIKIKN